MKRYSKLKEYFGVKEVMNLDSKYFPGKQEYSNNVAKDNKQGKPGVSENTNPDSKYTLHKQEYSNDIAKEALKKLISKKNKDSKAK